MTSSPHTRSVALRALRIIAAVILLTCGTAAAETCHEDVLKAERQNDIPKGLLLAMAIIESGRGGAPQAYALNVGGRQVIARSSQDAARYFRTAGGRYGSNIYVGCLQLSLKYHHRAFSPVHQIADPGHNTDYAAKYLLRHYRMTGNWTSAVGRYNGGSRRQQRAYVCKVWNHLSALDRRSASVLDASYCSAKAAAVAPRMRRALEESQVAANFVD